ncbi:juvenile hormone acid O-methyltransferase-like [Schistocerca americana]|uniref:juvenile hormone acid O-methyltransferase-like n=1 Tax=Schistocerca americana TaxID=7009 RepID=UPI001F503310|nr:juvenile hormone acid O-methyltransferase-like [Schistocerca americana]
MNDAELCAKSSSPQQQFVNKVLEELWPALEWRCEQGTVLDVGCGAGDVTTHELLPRLPPGVSVLAVDINPAMVAKAADRFSGPRLRFRQLDIGTPRIEETDVWRLGPFRKVFSFFCLHWVQDQRSDKLFDSGGTYTQSLMKRQRKKSSCVKSGERGDNAIVPLRPIHRPGKRLSRKHRTSVMK